MSDSGTPASKVIVALHTKNPFCVDHLLDQQLDRSLTHCMAVLQSAV